MSGVRRMPSLVAAAWREQCFNKSSICLLHSAKAPATKGVTPPLWKEERVLEKGPGVFDGLFG